MNVENRRLVVGGAVAAGAMLVMAAAVVGAGLAKADHNGPWSGPKGDHSAAAYWTDITTEASGTVTAAQSLADTICGKLDKGVSEGDLIANMSDYSQLEVGNVTFIVHAAEWHFCPDHY